MKRTITISGFMVLFLLGCGTTYLKNSSNVSKTKKKYDKVLVVARAKDKVARIKFEDQVVKDLGIQGVNAVSSINAIKTESFSKELSEQDIEKIRTKLVAEGYSGVIITNLINTSEYTDVILGGLVGTASGILVPYLHKNKLFKNENLSLIPIVGEYNGIRMAYKF